jgi:uncharacterized membrane protein (DUF2068 family)
MTEAPVKTDLGLRLVILYKLVKSIIVVVLAVVLAVGSALGLAAWLQDFATDIAVNLTRPWMIQLAEALFRAATKKHLYFASVALVGDGALTVVEVWGLYRRKRWAPWLVVVASGGFLPIEIFELTRKVTVFRVLVLLANVAIVAYLARRIVREHRAVALLARYEKQRAAEAALAASPDEKPAPPPEP